MIDRDRILARLQHGPVSPVDYQSPTCDGAKPVLRVAARVKELREQGYEITTSRASNGCAIYTLAPGAEQGDGNTAGEPTGASPTVAALGVINAAALGSPPAPAAESHPSFSGSPGHVEAGQSLPLQPSGLGGPLEPSLGVMDGADASGGRPAVAGTLFDAEQFADWRDAA